MEPEDEPIDTERLFREMPTPSDEMLASPAFEAVWRCIQTWTVNVPAAYQGHWPTTGSHVRLILDALAAIAPPAPPHPAEVEEMRGKLEARVSIIEAFVREINASPGGEHEKLATELRSAASLLSRWPGGWRPIETAPKDGTEILIGRKGECPRIVVTYEKDNDPEFPWALMADSSVNFAASWPTHWSPLPEPPNE